MTNTYLVAAVLAGLALLAMVYAVPPFKPAGIVGAVLVLAYVLWRWWEGRR